MPSFAVHTRRNARECDGFDVSFVNFEGVKVNVHITLEAYHIILYGRKHSFGEDGLARNADNDFGVFFAVVVACCPDGYVVVLRDRLCLKRTLFVYRAVLFAVDYRPGNIPVGVAVDKVDGRREFSRPSASHKLISRNAYGQRVQQRIRYDRHALALESKYFRRSRLRVFVARRIRYYLISEVVDDGTYFIIRICRFEFRTV